MSKNYAPYVRDIIDKYGNSDIIEIYISRKPIMGVITNLLNVMTLGKLKERMKQKNYDELFHLRLMVRIKGNKVISVEKNERINMEVNNSMPHLLEKEERRKIELKNSLKFSGLIKGSERIQGENLFEYSGHSNNCQDYVMALLVGSNLGNEEDYKFVKQDTESLFRHFGYVKAIQDGTTDIAGDINDIVNDNNDITINDDIDMIGTGSKLNIKTVLNLLSINNKIELIGTNANKVIKYHTDYDTQEIIKLKKEDYEKYVNKFQDIFKTAKKSKDIFITDMKSGRFNTTPIRWKYEDIMRGYKTFEHMKVFLKDTFYNKNNTVKIDIIAYIDEEYVEFSCNYYFENPSVPIEYIKLSLLQDIKRYYKEKKYMKMLKRIMSLRSHLNEDVKDLITFFNSDAGFIYQQYHKLNVIISLLETKQKVPYINIKNAVETIIKKLHENFKNKYRLNKNNYKNIITEITEELNIKINNNVKEFLTTEI